MDGPPDGSAPGAGRRNGATKLQDNVSSGSWRGRAFPLHEATIFLLAALMWPPAVARFRELGIRPNDIADDDARAVAAAFVNGRSTCEADLVAALAVREPHVMGLGEVIVWADDILCQDPTGGSWAVQSVERFALYNARYWFPSTLVWVAQEVSEGRMAFEHAMFELDKLGTMARPGLLRDWRAS